VGRHPVPDGYLLTIDALPTSGMRENGSSIIIHALPDLYCPDPTDPNGAGDGRTACGIIRPSR